MPICRGPALAGSRGYPWDEGIGERRHMRRALIGPSLRGGERERERDQMGVQQGLAIIFLPWLLYPKLVHL